MFPAVSIETPMPRSAIVPKLPPLIAPERPEAEKRTLGQYFTPPELADFIAGFFTHKLRDWRLIDAGAGAGALTLAAVKHALRQHPLPRSFHVTAYEIDPAAILLLRQTLAHCDALCAAAGVAFSVDLRTEDFIDQALASLERTLFSPAAETFNAAIANPPYRKLSTTSSQHRRLCAAGIEVSNLYSAFLALLSRLLEKEGELAAIVPRSFCNGPYFRSFRRDFLSRMAFRRLHVFGSRSTVFSAEAVLQENIVFCAHRSHTPPSQIEVSASSGADDDPLRSHVLPWHEIVAPSDPELFIHLPSSEGDRSARQCLAGVTGTLAELDVAVSTGKVVDFRVRELLQKEASPGTHPLLYPCHFRSGLVAWPQPEGRKPNAIAAPADRTDLLVPVGTYVVVRRFSAKEERKRIVASILSPERLPSDVRYLGLENHLNYFHCHGAGLSPALAAGLAAYLNWSVVDTYFRQFNGHTQVNATDLRRLPYPPIQSLIALGEAIGASTRDQNETDRIVPIFCQR